MDEVMIGARLRTLRRWRGKTQAELAGLSGLSPSFLSMVEHGKRMLDRRSHIAALADALRVSETDLVGGPHLSADRVQSDPHMAIPALRAALQINKLNGPAVEHARSLPDLAQELGRRVDPLRARCDYSAVGKLLPDVLDELYAHIASPADEPALRLALATLVEACVAANELASVTGYADLAHLAAVRAEEAAGLLGDPVQLGKTAVLSLFAYPQERTWDRRLRAAERAADALEPYARDPLGFQVLGMLTLHAAMAAAVVQRPHVISHWLAEAAQLARRVPDDPGVNWQYFSTTSPVLSSG
jgi:transcriptional regulator with XRE-family HTH domain